MGVRREEEKRGEKEREYEWPKLQFKQTVPESGWGVTRQEYLAIVPKNSYGEENAWESHLMEILHDEVAKQLIQMTGFSHAQLDLADV